MDEAFPDVKALPWRRVAMVCRKCAGKRDGGLDADGHPVLRQAIKAALDAAGVPKKDVRIAETSCLGLCPEAGISVLIPGIGAEPTTIRVVRTDADRDAIVAALRVDLPAPL